MKNTLTPLHIVEKSWRWLAPHYRANVQHKVGLSLSLNSTCWTESSSFIY